MKSSITRYVKIAALFLVLLIPCTSYGQRHTSVSSPIRRVDFRNFTYPLSSDDTQMLHLRSIHVRNGRWDNGKADSDSQWQAFSVKRVIYGDLTGNGEEEAVILTATEWVGANPANSMSRGLYVYAMNGQEPVLRVSPDGLNYWRDYSRYENSNDECDGWVWDIVPKAINKGLLVLDLKVGGRQCVNGGYKVTMNYKLSENRLILAGNPLKRKIRPSDMGKPK